MSTQAAQNKSSPINTLVADVKEELEPLRKMKLYQQMGFSYDTEIKDDALFITMKRVENIRGMDVEHAQTFRIKADNTYDRLRQMVTEARLKFFEMGT